MKLLSLLWAELIGLFVDDEFLALAILAVVLAAALLSYGLHVPGTAVGGVLFVGNILVLLASVYRGATRR